MNNFIAVLITCYNRKDKTLSCLTSLYNCIIPESYAIDIYLVDDCSTDGTGEAVKTKFPQVNIIYGSGDLYWNRGMRLAWNTAAKYQDYDFYLWLNDDTILEKFVLNDLLACYTEAVDNDHKPAIIVGACKSSIDKDEFSYGGRVDTRSVIPNGELQTCKYINGNVVLVPKTVYKIIGNLSPDYTHTIGDFDYGLRAINASFNCYTTKSYIAICPLNDGIPAWYNPKTPLKKRLQLLHSIKGLNIKEYNTFRKKFWGYKWVVFGLKAYLKALFPSLYRKMSNQ